MLNFKLISEIIKFITKLRYSKGLGGLSSEEIWELKQRAREDAERKAIDEGRAIVPKHVEIKKNVQKEKAKTSLKLKKKIDETHTNHNRSRGAGGVR